jgi:dephospho-CoA kinase
MARRVRILGLLGGIGSGKSAVASIFEGLGARTIDADAIAHRVIDAPAMRRQLVRWWGPEVVRNGRVNRAAVARRAFASPAAARRLNRLLHPRIGRELNKEFSRARRRGGVVVVEAALLLETGTDRRCDVLVFVDAPRAVRLRRIGRRGWAAGELRRREKAQWPLARKRARADYVIDNGGSKAATRKQVARILQEIASL